MEKAAVISQKQESTEIAVVVFNALLVTFMLFYLDEGFYSFEWMQSIANWIPFILYTAGIIAAQVFTNQIILKTYSGKYKLLLTAALGIPSGIGFTILFLTQLL